MPLTGPAIYAASVAVAAALLTATREEAILSGPEYIRDADPDGLTKRIGLGLARQTCRRYADGAADITPARAVQYENACRPYLDSVGYGTGPEIEKPFDGGQCADVLYRVDYEFRNGNNPFVPATLFERGPLSVSTALAPGDENAGCLNGTVFTRKTLLGANGARRVLSSGCNTDSRVTSITPAEGGPNNCGNPPPVITQPEPPAAPGPKFEPIVVIPVINIDAGVTVNLDGTVDVEIGEVNVTIDPFGDAPGGGGGGVGAGDLVPDGGLAGAPADTGNGGVASGEAPMGQELVGVRVEVLEAPIGFNQYANNPAVVYRGIGYIRMGYSGRLALDVGASAVISPQFFLAPVRGFTNWEHRANTGFINRVTPFYRELPS